MDILQNTLTFHPQAEDIKKAYDASKKERNDKYKDLFKKLGIKEDDNIQPRQFIYCLPTGNQEFDEGIDYITPNKDTKYGIKGGGLPVGNITIIHGRQAVGKSSFLYGLCKNAKFKTLYIDTEGGVVDRGAENVVVCPIIILENCWTAVMNAIDSGEFNCIVIDSITNLKTREDMQKEEGEMPRMGQRAQVLNSFLTKLSTKLLTNDVAVVFVSQERQSFDMFKKDPVLPGGESIKYAASLILGLTSNKADEIKDKDTQLKIGQKTKIKIRKNRYGSDNCEFVCKTYFNN